MIGIRHHLLARRPGGRRGVPVQVENGVETALMQQIDVGLDGRPIGRAGIRWVDAIDVEPAIFVQGNPDGVDVPGGHGDDGSGVIRAIEDPPPLDAGVFRTGAIDAQQPDGPAVAIDQLVGRDSNRKRCGRHCGGWVGGRCDQRCRQQQKQANSPSTHASS